MSAAAEGLQSSAPQGVFVFGGYLAVGSPTARSLRFERGGRAVGGDRADARFSSRGRRGRDRGAASSSSAARNAPQPSGTYREVDIFDQRANAWTRGPDLPNPRHGVGVVVVDGTKSIVGGDPVFTVFTPARLLVLGGGPLPGGSQTAVCEALDLR